MATVLPRPSAAMMPVNSILIVDDEPAVRTVMARWVADSGLAVRTARNAAEALAAVRERPCDLAVIDVRMPGPDGVWLKNELHRTHPHTAVVLATAYSDVLNGGDATADIADLLVKPFARDRFLLAVDRGRQWRKQALEDRQWDAQLSIEVRDRIADIGAALRTASAAGERELGVDRSLNRLIELAARFHDAGKAAMPEPLLTKPSPYTPGEQATMRRHVEIGAEILAATRTLTGAAALVLATHEWFGGGGYPLNLSGDDIPIVSRIIAVADAYDSMTEPRHARAPFDSGQAISELLRCAPTQFDPIVVTAFLAVLGRT